MNGRKRVHTPGESFVWFTSMGLTIGLAMVLCLMVVIVINGAKVFWPNRILQVQLKDGSVLGGALIKEQQRRTESAEPEWQLFTGNKDQYGLAFRFVDRKDIANVSCPPNVIRMERLEYGDAIGIPVELETRDGAKHKAGNADFERHLQTLIRQARERWKLIQVIEKRQIGRINAQMETLQIQKKLGKGDVSEIQQRMASLQADYDQLAKKASELRSLQKGDLLRCRLLSGEVKDIQIGDIVQCYYPNQLGFLRRIGFAVREFWMFLSTEPREANTEGGIFPAIFGTFVMTLLLSLAVTPFGVLAAIYLREYAKQGIFVRAVRIAVNNLAGVPSIVFGVFGLGFFIYMVGGTIDRLFFSEYWPAPTFGTGGILWASLTLALMTVPVVIVATEESLTAVPRGMREGSLACGASKWQTIQNIVLPASAPGILTGLILAMARGAGEVAPLMLVGVVKLAPSLPLDTNYPFLHLDQKFMHLGFHIYDLGFQSPDSEAAKPMVFATTFLLILLVVLLNLGAIVIRERLRKKFATGAF
jgi:phosphate transport system permease protein